LICIDLGHSARSVVVRSECAASGASDGAPVGPQRRR
jgi:hypothetical protein